MKRSTRRWVASLLSCSLLVQSLATPAVEAGDLLQTLFRLKTPRAPRDGSVERLAQEIDWLERHIDQYGSVVAKHPDVWGEARLTKHRSEFETEMLKDLSGFEATINGAVYRSDQTYLLGALALSSAASGGSMTSPPASQTAIERSTRTSTSGTSVSAGGISVVTGENTNSSTETPRTTSGSSSSSTGSSPINTSSITAPAPYEFKESNEKLVSIDHFLGKDDQIALEPTLKLDQKRRYLEHLQQLRRINEGDDTADAPGYSLNLMRIPVSILPGKATRRGYGAEITVTATPHLSPELLPMTFRNLVVNDLVDQMGYPITRALNGRTELMQKFLKLAAKYSYERKPIHKDPGDPHKFSDEFLRELNILYPVQQEEKIKFEQLKLSQSGPDPQQAEITKWARSADHTNPTESVKKFEKEARQLSLTSDLAAGMSQLGVSASRTRRARLPFPTSQLREVFALNMPSHVLGAAAPLLADPINQKVVHMTTVQTWLQEEVQGAYELLSRPENTQLWQHCTRELANAVRDRSFTKLDILRECFVDDLADVIGSNLAPNTAVAALAWGVIVESAVLNDRLAQDMHEVTVSKGCHCGPASVDLWPQFYLPDPPSLERAMFNDYVACRWPIHVFALDPSTDDQNIADLFVRRRELQLAMSMAFVQGHIGANALLKFARRIDTEIETIALNRTAVGFSHGNDTFGWRFFPRLQTPPIRGTVSAFSETLFGSRPDADLMQRQIEPGIRECVAIVIMPSFVPYVTFDSRSNWFRLDQRNGWLPTRHDVETSMSDAMRLSRSITAMRSTATQICDAHLYRDGEVSRLLRRVHQLDRELPLQTMQVQVPIENSLGGFEMFNNGIHDLAPELDGWYGAPGVLVCKEPCDPTCIDGKKESCCKSTKLFLVGNHFSIHNTRVLAGGKCLPWYRLVSRQVLEVEIGPYVNTMNDENGVESVAIAVATPYGVTRHLLIPVERPKKDEKPKEPEFKTTGGSANLEAVACCVCSKKDPKAGEKCLDGEGLLLCIRNVGLPGKLQIPVPAGPLVPLGGRIGLDIAVLDAEGKSLTTAIAGPLDGTVSNRNLEVDFLRVKEAIEAKLNGKPLACDRKPTKIKVEVYVQFDGGNLVKLANALEIRVVEGKCPECEKGEPVPTPAGEMPAGAPAPASPSQPAADQPTLPAPANS